MDATSPIAAAAPRPPRPLHRFAHPGRFLRASGRVLPWLAAAALAVLAVGLAWALAFSPPDWQQGETVRIMYVHVPMAWLAMGGYLALALASAAALVWRHPLADLFARELSPAGAVVTALCLATGSLWGKPMWGTWWVWDARLTSVLVLFFLWLGHAALVRAFDEPERGARAGAILALIGVVNLPIVKFSVDWWNTLHQPASVTRLGAPALHVDILYPLLVCALGFALAFAAVVLARTRAAVMERRIRALELARARREERGAAP
ncbi:heme ABC transporter permease [Caldovatus aquaticus]|uniref:heme ABC transporter permease n=1 Tax=Caldovatus aquaticus TaxID=2865671 RepID=UPI0034E25B41